MTILKTAHVVSMGVIESNCFILYNEFTKACIIIDAGEDAQAVIDKITTLDLKPELLINTHGHFDHILADDIIREKYNIPLAIHELDAQMLSDPYKNASVMTDNEVKIKQPEILLKESEYKASFCNYSVIHTPGHTEGSICILVDKYLFSGDTLFAGSIGRTDFFGGSMAMMKKSLEKLKKLDKGIEVFSGHGTFTTIGTELAHNIYLR
jgi:glyoxylase-like metal-dependent hydrolase (beta-lactamase superfamily II)